MELTAKEWITDVTDLHLNKNYARAEYFGSKKEVFSYNENDKYNLKSLYDRIIKERTTDKDDTYSDDFSEVWEGARFRVHLFHHTNGWSVVIRVIRAEPLTIHELGLHDVEQVTNLVRTKGLVLFCGPTGAGKSTTLAAVSEYMASIATRGICVSIENPIEHLYSDELVYQREVGADLESEADGIKQAMRASPDTIIIGEIRDPRTATAAVQAAQTGHLVMATLHAESNVGCINRMWSYLDDQHDEMLTQCLQGIMTQHLVPSVYAGKSLLIYETLEVTRTAKSVLYGGSKALIRLAGEMHEQGRKTLAQVAQSYVQEGALDKRTADFFIRKTE